MADAALLGLYRIVYGLARPLMFAGTAQAAHERALTLLGRADASPALPPLLDLVRRRSFDARTWQVGGVALPRRLILAAGMVKGHGFETEDEALYAVMGGVNIMPGWRTLPRLVGPVEFGSFTRWPRVGNPGVVIWRDTASGSTHNRVGLRNPGARAAAAFLSMYRHDLPPVFGINIAVSPGVTDPAQTGAEADEALACFLDAGVIPSWFTLNLSCPNTEDDPGGRQTADEARALCAALIARLDGRAPLWVKLGPDLAPEQYRMLMRTFAEVGVRAVIATNTLGQPAPDGSGQTAGVGGGRLHRHALAAVDELRAARVEAGARVDLIGCGGVSDGRSLNDFLQRGAGAAQYYSALIFRGPLAAALIEAELRSV